MSETGLRGRWLWVQLLTPDPRQASEFYCSLFGWELETYHGAGDPYPFWNVHGAPIAGLLEKPKDSRGPASWLGYIGTTDVERTAGRAIAAGGRVLREASEVPTVGRFAVLADPWGAAFALYRPMSGKAPPVEAPAVGEFSWRELATDDVDGALRFYGDLFAWKPGEAHDLGELGSYRFYDRMGRPRGGIYRRAGTTPICHWLHYVRVARLEATVRRVAAAGGSLLREPMEVPGGDRVAICADPQGAAFALHEARSR